MTLKGSQLESRFIEDVIADRAKTFPGNLAVNFQNSSLNYSDLDMYINRAWLYLRDQGYNQGDKIAILLNNSEQFIIFILACFRAGIIVIPINTKYTADNIDYILNDISADLLITDKRGATRTSFLKKMVIGKVEELRVSHKYLEKVSKPWDDLAIVYYTSGSTGRPKGVMTSYKNLILGIKSVSQYLEIQENQKLAAILPFSFDAGLNFILSGLYSGAENYILNYVFPKSLLADFERFKIEGILLVPSVFYQLQKNIEHILPCVKFCASTGGTMPPTLVNNLREYMPNMRFSIMYGLTESFRSTRLHPDDFDTKRGSIGRAIPHAYVQIIDENGLEAKPGTVGEIVHSGPLVGLGYWNDPQKTAERFKTVPKSSPYAKDYPVAVFSGDMGWQDSDGYFYFLGRRDRLIKSRGFRIAPEEIEKVITLKAGLKQNYVFGRPHEAFGQEIIAVVETIEVIDIAEIVKILKQHLAQYMIPDRIFPVKKIPLNSNGKIDGKALIKEIEDVI